MTERSQTQVNVPESSGISPVLLLLVRRIVYPEIGNSFVVLGAHTRVSRTAAVKKEK